MNQKPTFFLVGLLVCGLANASCDKSDPMTGGSLCYEDAERFKEAVNADRAQEQEQRDERRRWESVQVIEGNNVTTYYPSGDGQSYTGYSLRPR